MAKTLGKTRSVPGPFIVLVKQVFSLAGSTQTTFMVKQCKTYICPV